MTNYIEASQDFSLAPVQSFIEGQILRIEDQMENTYFGSEGYTMRELQAFKVALHGIHKHIKFLSVDTKPTSSGKQKKQTWKKKKKKKQTAIKQKPKVVASK